MTQQTPPPVSGLAGVLSIVQAVVALVPRWLVVAAGVVAIAFFGGEAYLKLREGWATTTKVEAQSQQERLRRDAGISRVKNLDP